MIKSYRLFDSVSGGAGVGKSFTAAKARACVAETRRDFAFAGLLESRILILRRSTRLVSKTPLFETKTKEFRFQRNSAFVRRI